MKINLNLAVAPSFRDRFALAWSVPTTVVGLVVMVVLAYSTVSVFRSYRRAQAELAGPLSENSRLVERELELRRALDRPGLRDQLLRAQSVNVLIEKRQLSLSALAAKASSLLPSDTKLNALAVTRSDNGAVVRFEVNARDAQAVETFLVNLTKSPDFEDATTTSEGVVEQGQGAAGSEITVACTARYVGTTTGADEPEQVPAGSKSPESPAGAKAKAGTRGNAELTQNSHPGI